MSTSDQPQFDHERLHVYQLSLKFAAFAISLVGNLSGELRSIRDQLVRSSHSIPLNIAEGNGKRSAAERKRYFEIARGSAMESAAALDVLVVIGASTNEHVADGKSMLIRIVAMLSKMTESLTQVVKEDAAVYGVNLSETIDYEHEHEKKGWPQVVDDTKVSE